MEWGYMGKVPARGDFITHNMGASTRDLLFEWCQSAMAVSREHLGDEWLNAYLTAPVWHFSASPGGITENGMLGTMIPSVDRVGRHFPFIVQARFDGAAVDAWRHCEWASSMEDIVLAVLDDDWRESEWRQRLAEVQLPEARPMRLKWPDGEGNTMIPGSARENDWLDALLHREQARVLWWTQGSAFVEPVTLLCEGLPRVGQYAAMLMADWHRHGWQVADLMDA